MRPPCKRWPMRRQSSVASTSWSTTPRSTMRSAVAVSRRSARPNGTMRCARTSSTWQCCKAVVPQMRKAGGGSIINMASLAAIYGMPFALHYTVSKAAVVGLTRGLARELGRDNIRVNSIAPSAVLTESTREFFGEKHERARGHCDPAQHSPQGRLWRDVVARLRAVRLRHRADHRGRWRDRDACSERSADAGERSATTASACGAGGASHRGMSGAFPPRRGRDRTP